MDCPICKQRWIERQSFTNEVRKEYFMKCQNGHEWKDQYSRELLSNKWVKNAA